MLSVILVSTHSRPKAAASVIGLLISIISVSTHSRPKAAAMYAKIHKDNVNVSTHSRPKAAAFYDGRTGGKISGFNTQPPEGGCVCHA